MLFNKIKKSSLNFIGENFAGTFINILCKTITINEINKNVLQKLDKNNQNYILAFWHGKMIVPWYLFRDTKSSTIISQSRDGKILTNVLRKWNYEVKRGSSSKGGKEVLNILIGEAKNGKNILITPDGPRGPKNKMKAGAAVIAKKSGIPIILVGVYHKNKINLKSWDKFEIPKFFSKIFIKYSDPYFVKNNLSFEETDKMINFLENELIKQENEVEKICLNS